MQPLLQPRLGATLMLALAFAGCGDGGGGATSVTPPVESRIDVAVAGLPPGVNAAITITDPTGRVVANLSAAGQVFVAGPGTFNVSADAVMAGATTYVATVVPNPVNVPAPPGITTANVSYALAPPLRLGFAVVATGFASPTYLASPPGGSDIYVVEQPGRIRKLVNGVPQPPVLDISARVSSGGERGMLSLAFDPQFAVNGNVFVYFTDPSGDIAIERFTLSLTGGPPPVAAESTAVRVLTIAHRMFSNHNGGQLQFGTDGMLYIGTGDGGGSGDPLGRGQDLGSVLGKILRIGVSALPYRLPADNPFVGQSGRRPEVWAYGLRNPWRFSFDNTTRNLYIADVGQNSREEVNVVAASAAGLNYGWNIWEGTACYPSGTACNPAGITMPLLDYDHGSGCSVTGGYVYRGSELPEVAGRYFYTDYCNSWLRSFVVANGAATERMDWGIMSIGNIQSFGVDSRNELYALTAGGGVYKLVRQ